MLISEKNVISGPVWHVPPILTSVGTFVYQHLIRHDPTLTALTNDLTNSSLTYGQFTKATCSLANTLQNFGITSNDVVAICSENHVNYFVPIIACLFSAIPVTLINPAYTNDELTNALNITEPMVVFCSLQTLEKFLELKEKFACIKMLIVIDDKKLTGIINMDDFIKKYMNLEGVSSFKPVEVNLDQTAFIMWSSGTTGLPKGVMITHKNLNEKHRMLLDSNNSSTFETKASLGILPFFHAFGLHSGLVALILGRKIIVLEKFEPMMYLKCIEKYKIPILGLVPPLVNFLAKSPLTNKFDLSHVEEVIVGAGPISKDLEDELKKRFSIKRVRQGYGLTETTIGLTVSPLNQEKHGSCGKVIPGASIVVKDLETGENLGPNKTGEICCKSDTVMKGYYRNEAATKEIFTNDGWMRTGDIGYYDEDDYFYIVDRLKELIKYKGYQVAPAELERILATHPKIQDAAVVGLPDVRDGEKPMAFIVKAPNTDLTKNEIFNYLKKFVSKNKYLHGGIVFVSEIPRSNAGKILRVIVKKMAKDLKAKL